MPFGLVFLWGYTRFARLQVRTIRFYEDRLLFSGREGSGEIKYEEIARLEKRRGAVFWVRSTQVLVFLKGRERPILLAMNPKLRGLKADLYSWLSDRVSGGPVTDTH